MKLVSILISLLFIFQNYFAAAQYITDHPELTPYYSPTGRPRMVAEWEPAIGTLVAWPLSIPYKLAIDLANDNRLYLLVGDRAGQQDAINWLTKWGVTPERVKFIAAPQGIDVSWTRDWGPHGVFATDGTLKLADAKYLYATPVTGLECRDTLEFIYKDSLNNIIQTQTDDRIPEFIANSLNMELVYLPFAFTGGNVFTDGQRTGISSCALTNENRFAGVSDEKFFHDVRQLLGIENHHIISNFEEKGIQHIDCMMKLLDEDRILVARPPKDHPRYDQIEGIVQNELSRITNSYGKPFEILRINTDRYAGDKLAAYTNSLILNNVIYVPLFGINQDSIALQQWRAAMPGYVVKGYEFKLAAEPYLSTQCKEMYEDGIGWTYGDALHCRTRAVWDQDMIYMSSFKVREIIQDEATNTAKEALRVIIKDYSQKGLDADKLFMFWRKPGEVEWRSMHLQKDVLPDNYFVFIPTGENFEYYYSAESYSGRKATFPIIAPESYFSSIQEYDQGHKTNIGHKNAPPSGGKHK